MSASSMSPCCISTHTQSNPQFAKISADMALGTVNHPPSAAPPCCQIPRNAFSRMPCLLGSSGWSTGRSVNALPIRALRR